MQRTKTPRKAQWVTGTPKSARFGRTVPLPHWLATRLADYLATTHPRAADPIAPLWPRQLPGGARYKGSKAATRQPGLDWSQQCALQGLQVKVIRPAGGGRAAGELP